MSIFDAQNALMPLLFRAAEWEVQQCSAAPTLVRRNSVATKLFTVCARLYGQVRGGAWDGWHFIRVGNFYNTFQDP